MATDSCNQHQNRQRLTHRGSATHAQRDFIRYATWRTTPRKPAPPSSRSRRDFELSPNSTANVKRGIPTVDVNSDARGALLSLYHSSRYPFAAHSRSIVLTDEGVTAGTDMPPRSCFEAGAVPSGLIRSTEFPDSCGQKSPRTTRGLPLGAQGTYRWSLASF